MSGGWTMSHMWMVMPGQSWLGALASFIAMWVVMMVAMMSPSLVPTLLRYRGWRVAVIGVAYFAVWTMLGVAVFPLGVAFADLTMRESTVAQAMPVIIGMTVFVGGVFQLSTWKAEYVARRRETSSVAAETPASVTTAWRHGLCLGVHCVRSCAGITAVALCLGVMDVRVMAAVAVATTAERRWHVFGRFLA